MHNGAAAYGDRLVGLAEEAHLDVAGRTVVHLRDILVMAIPQLGALDETGRIAASPGYQCFWAIVIGRTPVEVGRERETSHVSVINSARSFARRLGKAGFTGELWETLAGGTPIDDAIVTQLRDTARHPRSTGFVVDTYEPLDIDSTIIAMEGIELGERYTPVSVGGTIEYAVEAGAISPAQSLALNVLFRQVDVSRVGPTQVSSIEKYARTFLQSKIRSMTPRERPSIPILQSVVGDWRNGLSARQWNEVCSVYKQQLSAEGISSERADEFVLGKFAAEIFALLLPTHRVY